ncbi:MAG TPA: hypothetical protein VFU06_00860 [Longimicrobiales bacterium]|nr:hypothetical protein [Longimicrobiales bacterium]
MIGRILAGAILGAGVLVCPALASAQQSAAASVRIVVAPVDRVGFEPEQQPGTNLAAGQEQRASGGPSLEDAGVPMPSPSLEAGVVVLSAAMRQRGTDTPGSVCPRVTARPGFPPPVLTVTRERVAVPAGEAASLVPEVRRSAGAEPVSAPSVRSGGPVEVVTCTLIAP